MNTLFKASWTEMVFEAKNKAYGAFVLRQDSDKRHLNAMIFSFSFFIVAISLPSLITHISSMAGSNVSEVHVLSNTLFDPIPPKKHSSILLPEVQEKKVKRFKYVPPVFTEGEDEDVPTQERLTHETGLISTITTEGDSVNYGEINAPVETSTIAGLKYDSIHDFVDQEAYFPGGKAKMYEFLRQHLIYPAEALEMRMSGKVYLEFVVGRDGEIFRVNILKSVDVSLDNEAVRVINQMPAWVPGRVNGEAVSSKFRMPIEFKLK